MSSFLRRLSKANHEGELHDVLLNLRQNDAGDKMEELNSSFVGRDAEIYAPQLVADFEWGGVNERVLDAGCGTGKTAFAFFLPQVYLHDSHLYCVDNSESLISYATMKYPHPSVTYAVGDVLSQNFPFKYLSFDKIFALHFLQCAKDKRLALSRLLELLRPGGQLALIFATDFYCEQLNFQFSKEDKWKEYFEGVQSLEEEEENNSKAKYQKTLEQLGLEILKIKRESLSYSFPSLEKAVNYYMKSSGWVKGIPAELQEPFEISVGAKLSSGQEPSSPFTFPYNLLYVVARKPGSTDSNGHRHKHKKLRDRFSLP